MKQNVARKVGKKPISHERVCQLFGPQVGALKFMTFYNKILNILINVKILIKFFRQLWKKYVMRHHAYVVII